MFKAIWAARWYLLLGLFTFIIVLAVNTPLQFVWGFIKPQMAGGAVRIEQVSGTLWQGQARLTVPQLRSLGTLDTNWQLSPVGLLAGHADLVVNITAEGLRLNADARLGMDQQLQIYRGDGYLEAATLGPLLKANRISVTGNVELTQLTARLDLAGQSFADISGKLVYSGGDVGVPVNNKPVQAAMPMLLGDLKMNGDKALLDVTTTDPLPLMQGYLQPDGWGGVAVRRRFLDVLGQQWPDKAASEDTVIFEVSHKIL